jgi:sugar lactone lactonase YvrE
MNYGYGSRVETVNFRRYASLTACLLLLFSGALSAQNPNYINTIAGGASVNGPATGANADIPGPSAVAVDSLGDLYIAAPAAQQIYEINAAGTTISVFAGLGWSMTNPQSLDGQPAISGSLFNPSGVAVDASGNVYIADAGNNLIRKVSTKGIMTTLAGTGAVCASPTSACGDGGPAKSAQFNNPYAVATDKTGNVYVADTGDNRVRAINVQATAITVAGVTIQAGQIATIIGTGAVCSSPTAKCGDNAKATAATLNAPQGVVAAFGYVGVSDTGDHRVRAATPQGTMIAFAGNGNICVPSAGCGDGGAATKANLTTPMQIYADAKENVYVTDAGASEVREIAKSEKISTIAGNGTSCFQLNTPFCGDGGSPTAALLNSPRGIVLDSSGDVYIGDTGDQRIRKISAKVINTYAGGGNGNDGQAATAAILAGDRDVATDSSGNVYVADSANNRIRFISGGNISTVAGTGLAAYSGNSKAATAAGLNSPYGVWVDANSNIFIADTGNLVIRKVVPAGTITTIAGDGQPCVPATAQCGDGGPAQSASLTFPTKVTTDGNGNLYIADPPTNRVRMVDTTGNISTIAGTGVACTNPAPGSCGDGGPATAALLNQPYSVVVDTTGNIYIADMGDNRIRMIDTNGNMQPYAFNGQTTFGPNSVAALQSSFSTPEYMAIDSRANLYVSGSTAFYVIQRIDAPTATVMSVAGKVGDPTEYGYTGDGTAATKSEINNAGAALDSSENLYIAELGSNRVRIVNIEPNADLSLPSLNFPASPIGVASQPMSFTDKDTGSDDLVYSSTTISGPFAYVNPMPCTETAPSLKCEWQVVFTPTGYGVETGKANIYDNAYGYPDQLLYLAGSGPDYTITANPNSLTISPGNNGNSTITLTPVAGFNQPVNLTCTGAPSGTTCVPSPSQKLIPPASSNLAVTVGSSTAPGSYTLTVKGTSVTNHSTTVMLTVP